MKQLLKDLFFDKDEIEWIIKDMDNAGYFIVERII